MKENKKIPPGMTFTPVFDHLINDLGLLQTAIIGVIWRFSQMEEKICRASQKTIGLKLGLSRQALNRHMKVLAAKGYITDHTPKLRNRPHFIKLTEKVFILKDVNRDQLTVMDVDTKPLPDNHLLSISKELLSKNDHLVSIFELFGVTYHDMKKENKRDKEKVIRNISNNPFVDLLIIDEPINHTFESSQHSVDDENIAWDLPTFINYVFTFNILEFEKEYRLYYEHDKDQEIAQTIYRITEKGVAFCNSFMDVQKSKIDWDYLTSVLDFWFWYTLESNDRVENLQQMLSIYNQRNVDQFVKRYPGVYRKSPAVQMITEIVEFEPHDTLCPQIFDLFTGFNNPYEIKFIVKEIFNFWLRSGNSDRDFGWLFNLFKLEVLPEFDNPKKWWFRYISDATQEENRS